MFCPRCNHEDTKVLETRLGKGNHSIRRRRECLACAHRFSTIEEIVREGLAVVKRNGAREEFDMGKIAAGIRKATDKRPIEVERINLLTAILFKFMIIHLLYLMEHLLVVLDLIQPQV